MKFPVAFLFCLSLCAAALAQDTIFLVRHAEKQSDAQDTPLSDKGQARAQCLAQTLKDAHITTVFTSTALRTRQTAAPLARVSSATEKALDPKAYDQFVDAARKAAQSGNVLIVGHSNTLPDLIKKLGGFSVTIPDTSYDQLFVLDTLDPQHLVILHYCTDLPADVSVHPANSMAKP